jgi:LmbE family N-acetylglucosaminyl deacetylase
MTTDTAGHRPTLMTVHAHPDDETIGTGGAMAKAIAEGRRVVLVTCTRGEMGEIVVPEMDTPTTTAGWASSGRPSWKPPWGSLA